MYVGTGDGNSSGDFPRGKSTGGRVFCLSGKKRAEASVYVVMAYNNDTVLKRYQMHYLVIRGDIGHRITVVHIAEHARFIDQHLRGHSSQL